MVCGGRDFTNYFVVKNVLDRCKLKKDTVIISGNAKGADTMGERYARENGLQLEIYPANWSKYGKSAGPIRNQEMCNVCDCVIAFWDGMSRGTKNMIDISKEAGHLVFVFDYKGSLVKKYN